MTYAKFLEVGLFLHLTICKQMTDVLYVAMLGAI